MFLAYLTQLEGIFPPKGRVTLAGVQVVAVLEKSSVHIVLVHIHVIYFPVEKFKIHRIRNPQMGEIQVEIIPGRPHRGRCAAR